MKELEGKYLHYCYEWDGMLIDETCDELAVCCCYDDEEFRNFRQDRQNDIDLFNANCGE